MPFNEYEKAKMQFENEVKERATKLIKTGIATPYQAIEVATRQIQRERRSKQEV